jgi:uncharacterized protein (TIGR02646 family)
MRALQRTDSPEILQRKAAEWTKNLLSADTKEQHRKAEAQYRHKKIKEALCVMFHGKCAYCESNIRHVDYGDIEHYRPKSKFPALTFEWSNLLLACGVCNGKEYKGDRFPEEDQNGPLVNPCEEDPEQHFYFHYEPACRIASVYGTSPRGKTTEEILGLNRNELLTYRSRQMTKLYVIARLAASDPEAESLLKEAMEDSAEYAAFARTLKNGTPPLRKGGRASPSPNSSQDQAQ